MMPCYRCITRSLRVALPILMLFLLVSCLGGDRLKDAQTNPLRLYPFDAKCIGVTAVGDDFRYQFAIRNDSDATLNIRPDLELLNEDGSVYYTHTALELVLPANQTINVSFDTPVGPKVSEEEGTYTQFIFRAYTYQEEMKVRLLKPLPNQLTNPE